MPLRRHITLPSLALAIVLGLSSCGDETDAAADDNTATPTTSTEGDHDDEHHDEDEHHEDEGHEDEDHDEASGGLGAHEHGVAELSVAWDANDLVVDLISPAHNIFGFEHEPVTDEDTALVADRTEALTAAGVITINAEAGCVLADDVITEFEVEGSHAELSASWLFVCEQPDEIAQLDLSALFAEFPNLEDIDAQWASASGQSADELSPSAPILSLR